MKVVLLQELPWQEDLEGLPMKKELEALNRLPGYYTVTKTSKEFTKVEGGTLSKGEVRCAERAAWFNSFEKGSQVSIFKVLNKEMRGDPVVLWRVVASTESTDSSFPIFAQQLVEPQSGLGRDGKITPAEITNHISGVKVGKEASYTGTVEVEAICTTCEAEVEVVWKTSFCFMVDGKGKLEAVRKAWIKFDTGTEVELINTVVAQRD